MYIIAFVMSITTLTQELDTIVIQGCGLDWVSQAVH